MRNGTGRSWTAGLILMLATVGVVAGQGPAGGADDELPALPAARGTLSLSDEQTAAILDAVNAPEGFTVSAFAGPPVANYPTCVTATHDNVIFVCVDRNGSLQADPNMGYVARLVDSNDDGIGDFPGLLARLELVGGRLEVESEPGRGTRVTIVMPGHAPETGTDRS